MIVALRWVRLALSYGLFAAFIFAALNYRTVVYLFYQGKGQLTILINTQTIEEFSAGKNISPGIKQNLALIEEIKKYSTDSLLYKPTDNFKTIYDQGNSPVLWVLTVSDAYDLKAHEWRFPIVGSVSYKGYFKKELATNAYYHYRAMGYDVDLRSVSAWSTLGWFKDPILSNTLKKSKGDLCDLFFHELFHATYFAKSSVKVNENLANFIAHKATLKFLKEKDTIALNEYVSAYRDRNIYKSFMLRQSISLKDHYKKFRGDKNKLILKLKAIQNIADSLAVLPGTDKLKFVSRTNKMLRSKNAYFIDFEQYDSQQDSLEAVFNKFYEGSLKKMVRDLRQKTGNY